MFTLPDLSDERFLLVVLPIEARSLMLEVAGVLVQKGPLVVLDGGNQFNAYRLARTLRRTTTDMQNLLQRVRLSRAFTCYQMVALLQGKINFGTPVLALDLLSTFYDENVPVVERRRLLHGALHQLRELSREAPLVVSAHPRRMPNGGVDWLLMNLRNAADRVWEVQSPQAVLSPRLFP